MLCLVSGTIQKWPSRGQIAFSKGRVEQSGTILEGKRSLVTRRARAKVFILHHHCTQIFHVVGASVEELLL